MHTFKQIFLFFIFGLAALAMACSPLNMQTQNFLPLNTEEQALTEEVNYSDFETILNKTGCSDFQSYVWNYIYKIVSLEDGKPPPYYTVKEKIIQRIQNLMKGHPASKEDIQSFAMRFVEIYALVTEFMDQNQDEDTTEALVQFEHGIERSHSGFIKKLKSTFVKLDKNAKALNQHCQAETDTHENSTKPAYSDSSDSPDKWGARWLHKMRKKSHPLVYGARKVMSTAYQSCSALDIPFMPTTGYHTQGVHITSRHPSGNGWRRDIADLHAVNNSHYYLSQISIPNTKQCLNIHHYPLIYDYGGKPATALHSINLFKNAGSGSQSLGLDCSGFVASAMASAGLRLKPKVFIRPVHVKGINSWMFKNAHKNKLSCLQKQDITINNPIRSGDIIASNSHVFIVEFVGDDPLNLSSIGNPDTCHSHTIKLSSLQFSIIQSSAHNNGVGINRMHIKEAASGLHSIERGLKRIASRACYRMFGMETHTNINEISVLRHTSDVPACRDREIYLENQECLQSCEPQHI